jgi:hypothetical protein
VREPARLKAAPDWAAAAQLLVDGCAHAPDPGYRVELLERLCLALGDALYPAFLNVLAVVGERGTPAAQAAVADALVDALRSGRLPAGRRAAWGASRRVEQALGSALGPVEYLCAWYAEPQGADRPSAARFDQALRSLLALLMQSPRASALYAARLRALADDPLDGTLSRAARAALRALADAWLLPGATASASVDAVLQAVSGNGRSGFGALGPALVR